MRYKVVFGANLALIFNKDIVKNAEGRGFSYDNLKLMRKFYLVYSKDSIGETAFPQFEKLPVTKEGRRFYLSWSHYIKVRIV